MLSSFGSSSNGSPFVLFTLPTTIASQRANNALSFAEREYTCIFLSRYTVNNGRAVSQLVIWRKCSDYADTTDRAALERIGGACEVVHLLSALSIESAVHERRRKRALQV